uniref:Zinc finger MYM-type protein 3 n=1 Tax=Magallana gigas TaxID=29159 RepID=K1QL50_MAGGI
MQLPDLLSCSSQDLDHILSCFVIECRRADGSPYPPKTLYQLCAAILRFMRDNEIDLNFLDGKDMRFRNFRKTLDARMKQLATEGIGVTIRQADPISPEMENALWEGGHLGMKTSVALTNTIFFYNCKLFGLRGLDEHRTLVTEQFKLDKISDKMFITFYGRTSKNFAGGLNQRNLTAKEVKHDCGPDGPRNLFHVYQTYIDMVGPGSMYRRPLAGIEEQLVMSRTGHRSTAGRNYKRPSQEQLSAVSMALNQPKLGSEENECAAEFEANNSKLPKLMVDPMRTPMINITNCNVHIFDAGNNNAVFTNVAYSKPVTLSSEHGFFPGKNAVNGLLSDFTHTGTEKLPWLRIDLGAQHIVHEIEVFARSDCCGNQLQDFDITVGENIHDMHFCGHFTGHASTGQRIAVWHNGFYAVNGMFSDFIHTLVEKSPWLRIDIGARYQIHEIEVFARSDCCAKEKIDGIRRRKTGGGPPTAPLTQAEEALYQAMDTRPNIVGLVRGIDSDEPTSSVQSLAGNETTCTGDASASSESSANERPKEKKRKMATREVIEELEIKNLKLENEKLSQEIRIEEQLVMSRTGHRSTAVRNYKRPSQEQLSAVSMALNPPKLGSEENECAAEFEANNSKLPKLMVDPMRTPMINITNCNVHIFDAGNK